MEKDINKVSEDLGKTMEFDWKKLPVFGKTLVICEVLAVILYLISQEFFKAHPYIISSALILLTTITYKALETDKNMEERK